MTGAAAQLPSSPFRGIAPYRFVDSPIFFARKAETFDLLRSVIIYKGVLLYGNSGTGKSSLINAGLIPEILEKNLCPDRIRLQNWLNHEIIVERISLNDDGEGPFLSPSLADMASGTPAAAPRAVLSISQFKARLEEYAQQNKALLIFDQFEELITLFEEAPAQSALRDGLAIQQSILNLIVEILHSDKYPVKVLFAFREDYLAKLNKLFVMAPELPPQYVRVTLPRPNVLKDIIGGPFKAQQLREHFGPKAFSARLTNNLISDFSVRSENDEINLFEVQIVCQELWESEDPEKTFADRSGVPGLLNNYFDGQIGKLAADGLSDAAVALLSEMVTPTGTRNVISQYTLVEQVKKSTGLSEDILKKALAALVKDTGLVRGDLHRDSLYYEITSESMSPWILQKRKDRVDRELKEQAERAQREYHALLRRQRTRSLLLVSIATGVAFLILLGALWIYRVNTQSQLYAAQQREVQAAKARLQETDARLDQIRSSLALLRDQTEIAETDKTTAYRAVYEKTQAIDRLTKEKEALEQALQNQQPLLLTRGEAPRKRNVDRRSTMFGSTTLDIAIGLIMVFLLLSLVCTAVNEFLASMMRWRAKDLADGIRELLGDRELAAQLYNHPLIKVLHLSGRAPSYIPAATFALALIDIVAQPGPSGIGSLSDLRSLIASLPDSDLKRSLMIVTDQTGQDLNGARRAIENWFNSSMDRVSGAYKRRAQIVLLSLGLLFAVVINVDPITIANRLSQDSALRSSLVAEAQSFADQPQFTTTPQPRPASSPSVTSANSSSTSPAATPPPFPIPTPKSPQERIKENVIAIQALNLPLGWPGFPSWRDLKEQLNAHWLGWLLTAFAVSLGAPFWFDMLNKFMVVRSTVKPHEKSPEQPSKDRTATDEEESETTSSKS